MCRILDFPRSSYYYKEKKEETPSHSEKQMNSIEESVQKVFKDSRSIYGARKIKKILADTENIHVSRRKIRQIMQKYNLVSVYQKPDFKPYSKGKNDSPIPNKVNREFNERAPLEVIVSDLTYVRIQNRWAYVCLIVDLFNREIIGQSFGWQKSAELVKEAIQSIPYTLTDVQLFHSDRGKEFDNQLIDQVFDGFGIEKSLSRAGCPYDNAVAETTFKSFKIEFIDREVFENLEKLKVMSLDYIHWWNHQRIHGSLNYQPPMVVRLRSDEKEFINLSK